MGKNKSAGKKSFHAAAGRVKKLAEPRPGQINSGALPFMVDEDGELRVMLVTQRGGGGWIIPKGNIDKGMSSWDSAAKEALEEAGVEGVCSNRVIGFYHTGKSNGNSVRVDIFPMKISRILPEWEESEERCRHFFKIDNAVRIVRDEGISAILSKFKRESAHYIA